MATKKIPTIKITPECARALFLEALCVPFAERPIVRLQSIRKTAIVLHEEFGFAVALVEAGVFAGCVYGIGYAYPAGTATMRFELAGVMSAEHCYRQVVQIGTCSLGKFARLPEGATTAPLFAPEHLAPTPEGVTS